MKRSLLLAATVLAASLSVTSYASQATNLLNQLFVSPMKPLAITLITQSYQPCTKKTGQAFCNCMNQDETFLCKEITHGAGYCNSVKKIAYIACHMDGISKSCQYGWPYYHTHINKSTCESQLTKYLEQCTTEKGCKS